MLRALKSIRFGDNGAARFSKGFIKNRFKKRPASKSRPGAYYIRLSMLAVSSTRMLYSIHT